MGRGDGVSEARAEFMALMEGDDGVRDSSVDGDQEDCSDLSQPVTVSNLKRRARLSSSSLPPVPSLPFPHHDSRLSLRPQLRL